MKRRALALPLIAALALAGCAAPSVRGVAAEDARSKVDAFEEELAAQLSSLPASDLRDYVVESSGLGGAGSVIDYTDAELREIAYSFQYGTTLIFDVAEDGDIATAMVYVGGYHETGGGWSYEQETVHSCFAVSIDLTEKSVLGHEDTQCPDGIDVLTNDQDDMRFSELMANDDE